LRSSLQVQTQPPFSWYKRSEFGIRIALFFSAASISGAFGGFLAVCGICNFSGTSADLAFRKVAISKMDGIGGKPGWSWIFIVEGLATVVAGFLSFWIIQDFPDNAKFLSDAERTVVIRRLQSDNQHSAAGEKLKMKYILQSLI
jgi:sugar phosphate permease